MPIPVAPEIGTVDGPGSPGAIIHPGQVEIGGIVFGQTDEFGVEWILESLDGWTDLPPSTGTAEQKAASHGAWIDEAWRGPRTLALVGSLIATDWDAAEEAMMRLNAAIPLSAPAPLTAYTTRRILTANVRQDGDPLSEIVDGWARFSFSLLAPDHRRYGLVENSASTGLPLTTGGLTLPFTAPFTIDAVTISGVLSVTNAGKTDSPPVFTVTGPCPPFSLTHLGTNAKLSYPEAVPAGRTVVLDAGDRTALVDGIAPRFVTGSWFNLDPGLNEIAFTAASYDAGALLTCVFRDAYL